jgi:esterase/lipase superfamily enzyme
MSEYRSRIEFRRTGSLPVFRAFIDGEPLVFDSKGVGSADVESGPHVFQFFAAGVPGTEFGLSITATDGHQLWARQFQIPSAGVMSGSKSFFQRSSEPSKKIEAKISRHRIPILSPPYSEPSPEAVKILPVGTVSVVQGNVMAGKGKIVDVLCSRPMAASLEVNHAVVGLFFATNRSETVNAEANARFGADRGSLAYGYCEVSIPRDHRMGELEAPSILRLTFHWDPDKHVMLLGPIERLPSDQFFARVSARAGEEKPEGLVFIHGYNVTFEDAARRTAQLKYDLGFGGPAVFFSWPSQGTLAGYPIDEANIEWSEPILAQFLRDLATRGGMKAIFIIAHSMGGRGACRALRMLREQDSTALDAYREIILAAPDIDAAVFLRDIVPVLTDQHKVITLYASSKDKALIASRRFHGYRRAGESRPETIIATGLETIDASYVETDFLGHSYFGDRTSVISDMYYLVNWGARASHRYGLREVPTSGGSYWAFKKGA